MEIKCLECEHLIDINSTVCCEHHKVGLKYDNDRLSKIARLSKRCDDEKKVSEFYGKITDEMVEKFKHIYMDTSKSVRDLKKQHQISQVKWRIMAKEITRRTGYKRPRHDSTKDGRYITRRKGAKQDYFIIKHSNRYYGSYTSFERARLARDLLEKNGWNKELLHSIRENVDEHFDEIEEMQ